jgi:uncharacterized repeat protein (TIGR03803 family)
MCAKLARDGEPKMKRNASLLCTVVVTLVGLPLSSSFPRTPADSTPISAGSNAFGSKFSSSTQPFSTLVNFDGSNGIFPHLAALAQGLDGNLYGTADHTNTNPGTVFQMTPTGALTTIYEFNPSGTHGVNPSGGLVLGTDGNFYGITSGGGTSKTPGGTVFKVTPSGVQTVLHSFHVGDGQTPETGLIQASDGAFYGVTYQGGAYGNGTIFRITSGGAFASLHTFRFVANPLGALVQGTDGDLYGTTRFGLTGSCGTFFRFHPAGFRFGNLLNFKCTEVSDPEAALVLAPDAKFYGTSFKGGIGDGTFFKVGVGGGLTLLHSFDGSTEGSFPAPLILASDGNFYGTTGSGGACGKGTIFQLTAGGALTILHTFCGTEGSNTDGGLMQHSNGTFYGVTQEGGTSGLGTIFSLNLGLSPFVKTLPTSAPIGSPVTILGTKLTGATKVSFNGTAAAYTVVSDSEISTTVPVGATNGTVKVVTPDGTLSSNIKFGVAPEILNFSRLLVGRAAPVSSLPARASLGQRRCLL